MARRSAAGRALVALALWAYGTAGCGAEGAQRATPWNAPPSGLRGVSSGTPVERFFPLVDGYVYHYATTTEMGEEGLLVARVRRSGVRDGELLFPTGTKRFEYTEDGVVLAGKGAFVLKAPLEVGASWPGEHGGQTRVAAVEVTIEVPAGRFAGCVQTLEERLGDRPVRYLSTFCPDVGVVALEASGQASYEKAELKSYAPPLEMGPDGVQRTYVPPPDAGMK